MKIDQWYKENFETRLSGRYISLSQIEPLLQTPSLDYEVTLAGHSELGEKIPLVKIGEGPQIVLGWSQMHGNETTTTKAIFDFLKFICQKDFFQLEIAEFKSRYTFYIIPILNPDGAKSFTRENSNFKDLNRDAQLLSQEESRVLSNTFHKLGPSLCLNMHDQRSIYGFANGKAAAVSFLSPAADATRNITPARQVAMQQIVKMNKTLQQYIPGHVGRYDDSFNDACVGDKFQKLGVPTILFEAGHIAEDYLREKTREYIFYALLSLFDISEQNGKNFDYKEYFKIPENLKNFNDIILENIRLHGNRKTISIAVQYEEYLYNGVIKFRPLIDRIGNLKNRHAHRIVDLKGTDISTNSQEILTVGANISEIIDKTHLSLNVFQD